MRALKTHAKILDTARLLFNEHGVPQTSLRDIAKVIDISQGNLTYHFHKKESIFEELYFEFVDNLAKAPLLEDGQALTLKTLLEQTQKRMEIMVDYRFLFIDLNHTLREYPKIKFHFNQLGKERCAAYLALFKTAVNNDIMRGQAYKEEYESLATRIKLFNDHWLSVASVNEIPLEDIATKHHALLTEMLFPYFSHKIQREFLLEK